VAFFLAFSVLAPSAVAQTFKKDFLYKFVSNWADVATDGTNLYFVNSSYSQIDKYSVGGIHATSNWGRYGITTGKLKQPMGIALVGTNLYVADTGNSRIQRFDLTGASNHAPWGSYGSASGQYNEPQGVAVDSLENFVFVADTKNNRIQAITISDDSVASVAGSLGTGINQFSSPKGIAVTGTAPSITVYVADTGNNRIVPYTFNTTTKVFNYVTGGAFGTYGTGNVQFNQPNKITIDGSGNFYITDTTNRIQKFDSGRNFLSSWTVHDSRGTSGLAVNGTTLYVIEGNNQMDTYNAQTGIYSTSFTHESNQPVDVGIDLSGNIYIDNNTTNTVEKFTSTFVPLAEWAGNGSDFSGALGIGVNTGGEVVVADTTNNRIQRFDTYGTYLSTLPTPLVTPAGFSSPKDVANEATGKMYVADSTNNRILKYKSDNTPDWSMGLPTPTLAATPGPGTPTPVAPTGPYFLNPYGITVDSVNKIYIADSGYARIQKFDANGTFENAWGAYGSADNLAVPQFDNPKGMAIDADGNIYVADTGNNRIQRFDQVGTLATRVLWGVFGSGDGQFNEPRNVAVDSSNRVYVSEVQNKRVQVFGDAATSAGITIVETNGTAVTEDGSVVDSYTIKLNSQPSANVTITATSSAATQMTVSSTSLTFTPYNWNIPQVVTVIPVADSIDQAVTQSLTINHTSVSTDSNYNTGATILASVQVTLTDTDTAGISKDSTEINVTELGTTDNVGYWLDSKPTADVELTFVGSSSAGLAFNPASLTFTPTNWNVVQYVNITAVPDRIDNGNRDELYSHSTTTSATEYAGILPDDVLAHITDAAIDVAGVTLSKATLSVTEGGASGTYTVVLNTKPTANVTITPTASSAADLTVSPSTLTFTSVNWNTAQTVTVTAVNDKIDNVTDTRDVDIANTSSSTDTNYSSTVPISGGTTPGNIVRTTITDIDTAGIILAETGGSTSIIEGETTDTYTINLASKPLGNVIFELTSTMEATTAARFYTFTPSNWNTPQIASISGIVNGIAEGTHSATIIHTISYTTAHDIKYATGSAAVQNVLIYDTDVPDIVLRLPNNVINITEGGESDLYYVKLRAQPTATVTVNINGGTDSTASPSSMIFTTSNWNVEQIATVSAINNYTVENARTSTVLHTASSSDLGYDLIKEYLTVNIADDDSTSPGVQITQTGDSTTVTEAGSEDTYTMVLTSKPTAKVKVKVLGNNGEATSSGALFTFLTTNWNVPQTVHVLARDDSNIDGTKTTIFQHIVTSTDLHYNAISVDDVTITVIDNDAVSASTAKPQSCSANPPGNWPNLFQINTTNNSATLYFTPIRDNISYYYVAYGLSPGDVRYGVSFDQGSYDGVLNYKVYSLASGTKYYFKIRGGNGCATGPWGNESSATTTASGSAATRVYYTPASSYATTTVSSGSSGSSGGSSSSRPQFTYNLYPGSRGALVRSLQVYLNSQGFIVAQSGPGSPGNETDIYGPLTASAVRRFQEAHYAEILSPLGYSSGTGILGPSTRAYINSH
jgi:sugar lactone lactonase YvrE